MPTPAQPVMADVSGFQRDLAEMVSQVTAAGAPEAPPTDEGFAPEPPDMIERLFTSIEARQGISPMAAARYVDTMITTLIDIKKRTVEAVGVAEQNVGKAQDELYALHSELSLFKSNLVPHSVHSYGRVIPNVTPENIARAGTRTTKEQVASGIEGLRKEFADVRLERVSELNRDCLVVRTHNVILQHPRSNGEGMMEYDFGPFEIALDIRRFESGQRRPYFVLAVEPHPAPGGRNGVTHPHINDRVMCEGNAGDVIHKVLSRGDLYTFFVVVNQTLNVYNRHSPHVPIEEWVAARDRPADQNYCCQCDGEVSDSNRASCDLCGSVGHDECMVYCEDVSEYFCENCIDQARTREYGCGDGCDSVGHPGCRVREDGICGLCENTFEPGILLRCPVSSRSFCPDCLQRRSESGRACCGSYTQRNCILRTRHGISAENLRW